MNYIHFTFENIFEYKSTLEQLLLKEDIVFEDYVANVNSLRVSFEYKYTSIFYQDIIASICNSKYEVTTTIVCDY